MNEYIEKAIEIKDTISEYIPKELNVIIKLAELAFNTFGKSDTSLKALYKKAFKEAVENAANEEPIGNVRNLLNEFKNIDSFADLQELIKNLNKVSNEMDLSFTKKDFSRIASNISEEFDHILLEEKYDKLYKGFILCRKPDVLYKKAEDIKETLDKIYEREFRLNTHNKIYAQDYVKPMFLHKYEKPFVMLKNVFVMPNVKIKENVYNALDTICDFIKGKDNVLFIEGCGGYGKSSIVSFIAYNYLLNNTNPDISFLENKQLIIIRLRKIDGKNKIEAIKKELNNIDAIENDAVLIFDGLDEICMMDNVNGSVITSNIIKAFSCYNRKIIITTRPTCMKYDKISSLNTSFIIAEICCFNEIQRNEFADSFSEKDDRHMEAVEYVKNLPLEKQENESIYGSPFLLYLILSGGIKEEEKNNSWLLMHRLFHDDLFNPPYGDNRGIDDKTADNIYQFNCDIAYEMFKTSNEKLFMTNEELNKILKNGNVERVIEESHGLFSYMKKSTVDTVEFVHNHIRDYFLCEKILREIDEWYSNEEIDGYQIVLNLGEYLKYHYFTDEVVSFIKEAIQYSEVMRHIKDTKNIKNNYIYKNIVDKCDSKPLSDIFNWFYRSGGIVKYDFKSLNEHSYDFISSIVISNAACIYKAIYELKIKDGEYLHWTNDKMLENSTDPSIFEAMSYYLDKAYLKNADLININLIEANLNYTDLSDANLIGADLTSANLTGADLTCADLSGADLSYADLTGADLSSANLEFVQNISEVIFGRTKYNDNTKFPDGFVVSEPKFIKNEWY